MARVFTSNISLTNGVREGALFLGQSGDSVVYWCAATPLDASKEFACSNFPSPTPGTGFQHDDVDNVAYRMYSETLFNGMTKANFTLANPVCWTGATLPGTAVTCDKTNTDIVRVTMTANYRVPLLTPVLSTFFSNGITVTASTTAQVQGR
jgi:hypothetical protein